MTKRLCLLLLLALVVACTPRGRGGSRGDDDDDDSATGDDDDSQGDDDDSQGDDDDSQASFDGDYFGEISLGASVDGGEPLELCLGALSLSVSGSNLVGGSSCTGFLGEIPIAISGVVAGSGTISGTATVDLTALGGSASQGSLDGSSINGGAATIHFEAGEAEGAPMIGDGTATRE